MERLRQFPPLMNFDGPTGQKFRHRRIIFSFSGGRERLREPSDRNINPFEEKLRRQDILLDVPERFLEGRGIPRHTRKRTHIDTLTGLPVEDGEFRTYIANKFSECIKKGKHWIMIYNDADNVKQANTSYKHDFGDMVIKNGAARPTQAIDQLDLPEDVTIYATRQTGAADETVIWLFDLSDEQLRQVQLRCTPLSRQ